MVASAAVAFVSIAAARSCRHFPKLLAGQRPHKKDMSKLIVAFPSVYPDHTSPSRQAADSMIHSSGLTILPEFLGPILTGAKVWELRKPACMNALKSVYSWWAARRASARGIVKLTRCLKLTTEEVKLHESKHRVAADKIERYANKTGCLYAWMLAEPHSLQNPMDIERSQGSLGWVKVSKVLDSPEQQQALSACRRTTAGRNGRVPLRNPKGPLKGTLKAPEGEPERPLRGKLKGP